LGFSPAQVGGLGKSTRQQRFLRYWCATLWHGPQSNVILLHYGVAGRQFELWIVMPTPVPHPHHHPDGGRHPTAAIAPSILRMALTERLIIVAVMITVIWGAVLWAMV
jgi:hypothetical protein